MNLLNKKMQVEKPRISLGLGIYGPPQAGKTTALSMTKWDSLMRNLPSGMEFGVKDPREFNANRRAADEKLRLLASRGLPATEEIEANTFELYDGTQWLVSLHAADSVGQTYSNTVHDSPSENQQRFEEQVHILTRADILWYFLPMPPKGGSPSDLRRFESHLKAAKTYLREALRKRREGQSCSLAIVLSKTDLLFDSSEQAREEISDEHLVEVVQPLVSVARASDLVLNAALLPISAMGFGKAMPLTETTEHADSPIAGRDDDEPQYVLPPGVMPEPYNTLPLLVYSMAAGLLSVEVDEGRAQELKDLYSRLRSDLASLDGWVIPVKGEL
jgi:hypothetical protein